VEENHAHWDIYTLGPRFLEDHNVVFFKIHRYSALGLLIGALCDSEGIPGWFKPFPRPSRSCNLYLP
jgi:hypothetical protein